jgi:chromosome segregation and condensation protein ScpB
MNDQYVKNVIEAALLAAGRPLAMDELVSVFDERDGSNAEEIRGAIAALKAEYETRVNPNIIKTLLERSWIRVVGHRDVPGKPELLGTTREFLDYFSLKKLDDLPTLAQLKELEDLRVQLTLPGAAPEVAIGADTGAADDDEEQDSLGAQDSDNADAECAPPRPEGLVASGALDDEH